MAGPQTHLVERLAARLRADAGLAGAPPRSPGAPDPGEMPFTPGPGPLPVVPPNGTPALDLAADGPGTNGVAAAAPAEAAIPHGAAPAAPPLARRAIALEVMQEAGLICTGRRTRFSEEYRVTAERVMRTLRAPRGHRAGGGNLLMITSARPGEGKSFSSLNLSASLVQNRFTEAVLIDVDDKPLSLSKLLGVRELRGLMNLCVDPSLRVEETMLPCASEGMWFLPFGQSGARDHNMGVTRTAAGEIERMARRLPHHVLVLDVAPCLSSGDASVLAPLVDQIIVVVEAEQTQRTELEAALEMLKACPNLTLLLNKVKMTPRHSFGAYYYFGEDK